jgi:hypothetical protein
VVVSTALASQQETADKAKKPNVTLSIRAATPKEEFGIIWNSLRKMGFYRKHGYDVALPDNKRFTELSESSGDFSGVDQTKLYDLFAEEIYDARHYEKGLKGLEHVTEIVENALPMFERFKQKWGFSVHPSYDLILTLYGPGGQYDPETGRIFLKTTVNGQFKRVDPTHIIIHEMVHIGIDEKIVKAYRLAHWEKERVVDLICSITFGNLLSHYRLQAKGDRRLDAFVNKNSIMHLSLAIDSYVKQKDDPEKEMIETLVVKKVFKGSQAENIGIQEGDILIEYDGKKIASKDMLVEAVKRKANKDEIALVICRGTHIERFMIKGGSIGLKIAKKNIPRENFPKTCQ